MRVLEDIPLPRPTESVDDLRARHAVLGTLALFVGNLEPYQGIDLLLDPLTAPGAATP